MCLRAILHYTCNRGHEGEYYRTSIYHQECHLASDHAAEYGVDWTSTPKILCGLGHIDGDKCRLCILEDILGLDDPQKMMAEYFKLAWKVNDTQKLLVANKAREQNAGQQAEAFIDAVQDRPFTGQQQRTLGEIKDESVKYWRQAWEEMAGARVLCFSRINAAELCRAFTRNVCHDWQLEGHTANLYSNNSLYIHSYLSQMRRVVPVQFSLEEPFESDSNSDEVV